MRLIDALERPDGRVAVRDRLLVMPSVGCANRVCDLLAAQMTDLAVVTHQHGCSQIGDDLALTSETVAAIASHPNVRAAVVVGLGCESNQSVPLASRIRERGGVVESLTIQETGGVRQAVDATAAALRRLDASRPLAAPVRVRLDALRVAIVADAAASGVEAVVDALRDAGLECLRAEDATFESPEPAYVDGGVPRSWRSRPGFRHDAIELVSGRRRSSVVHSGAHDVERLTALTAMGAHVAVVLTGRASPIGSPIVPTVKVSTNSTYDDLTEIIDVPADPELVVEAVVRAAAGEATAAERAGQRDFALWRLAPSL